VLLLTAQRKVKQREGHALGCRVVRLVAGMFARNGCRRAALHRTGKGKRYGMEWCVVEGSRARRVRPRTTRGARAVDGWMVWVKIERQASAAVSQRS
jgi:hypothetical protein